MRMMNFSASFPIFIFAKLQSQASAFHPATQMPTRTRKVEDFWVNSLAEVLWFNHRTDSFAGGGGSNSNANANSFSLNIGGGGIGVPGHGGFGLPGLSIGQSQAQVNKRRYVIIM
jgi:hypothetical protein